MDNIFFEEPYLGQNNKYNYFYKIEEIQTKQYYYGVHITTKLNDNYNGSGYQLNKLYKEYQNLNKDINKYFNKFILKFFNSKEDAFNYEEKIVNKEILKDDLCLNMIVGGNRFKNISGMIPIHKDYKEIYINSSELNSFLKKGWKQGVSPNNIYIWVHNENESKHIRLTELDNYLANGYKRHKRKEDIKIWINNNSNEKYIRKIDFFIYKSKGWNKGKLIKNKIGTKLRERIRIVKDNKCKYIKNNELENYIKLGWELNKKITLDKTNYKNKVYIYKDNKESHILKEYLQEYLNNGWKLGRIINMKGQNNPSFNKKWIYKDNKRKYVDRNDLQLYLNNGWKLGFLRNNENYKNKNIWVTNEITSKKITNNELEYYLSNGWRRGKRYSKNNEKGNRI